MSPGLMTTEGTDDDSFGGCFPRPVGISRAEALS
jgi:hypothetical protein